MPVVNRGDVWMVDFGMAAKVRPAVLLSGQPADDELDVVTVLLHTTSLRGNQWELNIPKPFLKPGAFHLQQVQTVSTVKLERRLGALELKVYTRKQLPQDWAATQNNLGNALSDQAERSGGAQAARLLGEAVAAYKNALTVLDGRAFRLLPQSCRPQSGAGRGRLAQAETVAESSHDQVLLPVNWLKLQALPQNPQSL